MSGRELARWADPTVRSRPRRSTLTNPFAGLAADLRAVGRLARRRRPLTAPGPEVRPVGLRRPPAVAGSSLLARVRAAREPEEVLVTGMPSPVRQAMVALAHVESADDLDVLLATLPRTWHTVTTHVPEQLTAGRSVLLVTDCAAADADEVTRNAVGLAMRTGRTLLPIVVRRIYPRTVGESSTRSSGVTARQRDEVRIRIGRPLRDGDLGRWIERTRAAIDALLAEDDATWWDAISGRATPRLAEPMASWRRTWQRTLPGGVSGPAERRPPIWR